MKAVFGLIGLSILLLQARVHGTNDVEHLCTDGSRWYDDCNTCSCFGGQPACSKMFCPPDLRYDGGSRCSHGSRWMKDCNRCRCHRGNALCTLIACLPDRTHDHSTSSSNQYNSVVPSPVATVTTQQPANDTCISHGENDRWRVGCNWCSCTNGVSSCTPRDCSPEINTRLEGSKECEANAEWKDECNWCHCGNGRAICTRMACFTRTSVASVAHVAPVAPVPAVAEPNNVEVTCEERGKNARWRVGCNWCNCRNGLSTCTRRACSPKINDRLVGTKDCEGDAKWKKDCNWCSCHQERGVCNTRACINRDESSHTSESSHEVEPDSASVSIPAPDSECSEGFSWTESCNKCHCANGHSLCTRRFCLAEVPDTCESGARWKKDCNSCSCSETGVAFCTAMACHDHSPSLPPVPVHARTSVASSTGNGAPCAEDARWRSDDCNWCKCVNGIGVCDTRACLHGSSSRDVPECIQESVWSDGCNQCFCNNGRSICTQRFCFRPPQTRNRDHALIPDPKIVPQIQDRPIDPNQAVIPDPKIPQIQDSQIDRNQAVIPDPTMPQIQDSRIDRNQAVIPDPTIPQIQDRPIDQSQAVVSDPTIPQIQEKPKRSLGIPKDDRDCIPGSRYMLDSCNWCSCTETGIASCDYRSCIVGHEPVKTCEEGSRWRKDCNWCNCIEGKGDCTKLACHPVLSGRLGVLAAASERTCKDGSRWRLGCNWCNCNNGSAICDRRACLPGFESKEPQCTEGSSWKDACNSCSCSNGFALCTMMGCLRQIHIIQTQSADTARGAVCEPGSRWRVDCNWCNCTSTGIKICDEKLCNPNAEPSTEPLCDNGSWKDEDDCNWCHCTEGHAACTEKLCLKRPLVVANTHHTPAVTFQQTPTAEQQEPPQASECIEGTSWVDNCNMCRCRHGLALCTRKACFSQIMHVKPADQTVDNDEERCHRPADSGQCFASFRMVRFNSEKNRCEPFLYGGCGGNGNRFISLDECHTICGGDAPVLDSSCDRRNCPEHRQNDYLAVKNCSPVYSSGSCCATSYECSTGPEPEVSELQCLYHGTLYERGNSVPVGDDCSRCRCNGNNIIACANVHCPSSYKPGCRPLFREGECCSYDFDCEEPGASSIEAAVHGATATCESENRTYSEGSKMFFDNVPCQKCLCGAEYDGPYGPACQKINCGYDFRYVDRIKKGCIPLYYKNKCCPITFICPGDEEISEDQSQANPAGATGNICTFGDQTVAQDKSLATTKEKITCTCQTPPDVTCVQNAN